MSGLKERFGQLLPRKSMGMQRNFASLPRQRSETPGPNAGSTGTKLCVTCQGRLRPAIVLGSWKFSHQDSLMLALPHYFPLTPEAMTRFMSGSCSRTRTPGVSPWIRSRHCAFLAR
jgi:hypothetical protein